MSCVKDVSDRNFHGKNEQTLKNILISNYFENEMIAVINCYKHSKCILRWNDVGPFPCLFNVEKMWCVCTWNWSSSAKIGINWDILFKNGPSKICGRQPLKNLKGYGLPKVNHTSSHFLKAVFRKFYLVHSWILCHKWYLKMSHSDVVNLLILQVVEWTGIH